MKRSWYLIIAAGVALLAMPALQYLNRPGAGDEAPHFEIASAGGETVRLEDFSGSPVILHFWASWCGSCLSELPALARLSEEYAERGLALLAVSLDESFESAASTVQRHAPGLPLFLDQDGNAADAYHSFGVPDNIFIDRQGKIVWRRSGHMDWDSEELRARIERLIGE